MSEIKEIYESLLFEERKAVDIIKVFLDIYNNAEGSGLFKGMERYANLEGRIKNAAYRSQSLLRFWDVLIISLGVERPRYIKQLEADKMIFDALRGGIETDFEGSLKGDLNRSELRVIKVFYQQYPTIIPIARNLHAEEKAVKKAQYKTDKSHLDGFKAIIESENSDFQIDRYLNDLLAEEIITIKESIELKNLFLSTIKAKEAGLNQSQIDLLNALKQLEITTDAEA